MLPMKRNALVILAAVCLAGVLIGCSVKSQQAASPWLIQEATSKDIAEAAARGVPVVVKIGSDKCVPCREMNPVMAELAAHYQGKVLFLMVDVYKNQDLAARYGVKVIPTLIFIDRSGKAVGYTEGFQSVEAMKSLIAKSGIVQ